jgi:hypothetical protein
VCRSGVYNFGLWFRGEGKEQGRKAPDVKLALGIILATDSIEKAADDNEPYIVLLVSHGSDDDWCIQDVESEVENIENLEKRDQSELSVSEQWRVWRGDEDWPAYEIFRKPITEVTKKEDIERLVNISINLALSIRNMAKHTYE